jgi:hypothetical protein
VHTNQHFKNVKLNKVVNLVMITVANSAALAAADLVLRAVAVLDLLRAVNLGNLRAAADLVHHVQSLVKTFLM